MRKGSGEEGKWRRRGVGRRGVVTKGRVRKGSDNEGK